jgi:hypothetical protein
VQAHGQELSFGFYARFDLDDRVWNVAGDQIQGRYVHLP